MNNEERDDMIKSTHDAVIVMVKQVKDHDVTLYGNGQPRLVEGRYIAQGEAKLMSGPYQKQHGK